MWQTGRPQPRGRLMAFLQDANTAYCKTRYSMAYHGMEVPDAPSR
jgi:hypothetical protein